MPVVVLADLISGVREEPGDAARWLTFVLIFAAGVVLWALAGRGRNG